MLYFPNLINVISDLIYPLKAVKKYLQLTNFIRIKKVTFARKVPEFIVHKYKTPANDQLISQIFFTILTSSHRHQKNLIFFK